MHDSHSLKDTGKNSMALCIHWRMHGSLFRIVFEVSPVPERVALESTYLYENRSIVSIYSGRDSGRLLWWTDVRMVLRPANPNLLL